MIIIMSLETTAAGGQSKARSIYLITSWPVHTKSNNILRAHRLRFVCKEGQANYQIGRNVGVT